MKVAELEGHLLAEWVARANDWKVERDGDHPGAELICWDDAGIPHSFGEYGYRPDLKWEQGGPIIEREKIAIAHFSNELDATKPKQWRAQIVDGEGYFTSLDLMYEGDTALIAAMRAYVASKFGDTVDSPAAVTKD